MSTKRIGLISTAEGRTTLVRARRRSWLLPALAIAAVAAVSLWVNHELTRTVREMVRAKLVTIRDAEVKAVGDWLRNHEAAIRVAAQDPGLQQAASDLVAAWTTEEPNDVVLSKQYEAFRTRIDSTVQEHGYAGYGFVDTTGRVLIARNQEVVGLRVPESLVPTIAAAARGRTVITPPLELEEKTIAPSLFVATPLRSVDGRPLGALVFRVASQDLSSILEVARAGKSGETYAFNRDGFLISESRFPKDLVAAGLIESEEQSAILRVDIRDPGGDLTAGYRPDSVRRLLDLTRMARDATAGGDEEGKGIDIDGYRDYRGIEVVGAWKWFEDYKFGIATEIDKSEAYGSLATVTAAFWVLVVLLGGGAVGGLALSRLVFRLRARVSVAQQLGQYTLGRKIGEGGMGSVYEAHHAMMRRPAAIKVLRADQATKERVARFEREVQLTSQLTHPNTIAIYDYGRTPADTFYYVMEYLPGISLEKLVKEFGPLPSARAIHILKQAALSLNEAHSHGMIHRDVTPGNIVICERGGIHDTVKVLDFGLVKDVSITNEPALTQVGAFAGTPQYIAPETLAYPEKVDSRIDIYALGAVGYYLVAGRPVFQAKSLAELLGAHMNTEPVRPSQVTDNEIAPELEGLILQCLEKRPEDRPQTGEQVFLQLEAIRDAGTWGPEQSRAWWKRHGESEEEASDAPASAVETRPAIDGEPGASATG